MRFLCMCLVLSCGPKTPLAAPTAPPLPPAGAPAFPLDGAELRWGVADHGQVYDFVVRPARWAPSFTFAWVMTGPVFSNGRATVTPEALESCVDQVNRFRFGAQEVIDGCTVVFSRQMFAALRAGEEVVADIDGRTVPLRETGTATYEVLRDGALHPLSAVVVEGPDTRYMLLDDPDVPVILRQNVGFPVWLKEVRTEVPVR